MPLCNIFSCKYNKGFRGCSINTKVCPYNDITVTDNSNSVEGTKPEKPEIPVGPNVLAAICSRYSIDYADRIETNDFIFVLDKGL